MGKKVGKEVFYRPDGSKEWEKHYDLDGNWTWQIYDAAGKQTSESHWHRKTLLDATAAETR
jgi:antitoxin component YwqK of YwqJK toxin-antitoxin module